MEDPSGASPNLGLEQDDQIECGQEIPIEDDDHILRRFIDSPNHLEWDADNERFIPAANQLQFDPEPSTQSSELSTQSREHLWDVHHLGPEAVLDNNPNYSLVGEWLVDSVRKHKFPVKSTPDLTVEGPLGCSHVSIYWPADSIVPPAIEPSKSNRKKLRSQLAREMTWVYGQITIPPPDGAS